MNKKKDRFKKKSFKILHIITTLERGGAQKILTQICNPKENKNLQHLIICLANKTDYSQRLVKDGFEIKHLNGSNVFKFPIVFYRLLTLIYSYKPNLINTWLYHADFVGSIIKLLYPKTTLLWSVHHASSDLKLESIHTKITFFFLKIFSYFIPDKIIYCSKFAQNIHHKIGFNKKVGSIINNGIDTNFFRFNNEDRNNFRKKLNISENIFLIGIVARYDPNKGINTFLEIVQESKKYNFPTKFLLCGDGLNIRNKVLDSSIKKKLIMDEIILLGEVDNIKEIYNGIDLLVCPSLTESFGLVVMEALLCKTKVICSNLDVLKFIVGSENVVNKNDFRGFCKKIMKNINNKNDTFYFKEKREFITQNFSLNSMKNNYLKVYQSFIYQV